MNNVEAFKKFFKEVFGVDAVGNTLAEVVDNCVEVIKANKATEKQTEEEKTETEQTEEVSQKSKKAGK